MDTPAPANHAAEVSADRQDYYGRLAQQGLAPLWEKLHSLIHPEPKVRALPYCWHYDQIRELMLESASVISTEEAERRVLMLENPGLRGECCITETLFSGLQLIMPGETARAHRHSPGALRFIIEGTGGYTAVNGEKTNMTPGDFIITPSWTWHHHGHDGDEPVVWLDGLDLPIARTIGAIFYEPYSEELYPEGPPPGDSLYRYGNNMRPVGELPKDLNSPIFSYPYARSRETLDKLKDSTEWDPYHGLKLEFIDPTSGDAAMATLSTFMQLMPKGFKTEVYQTTESLVFSPVEGKGKVTIGKGENVQTFEWKARDVFVIPCWYPHYFESEEESVIFSFSDKIIQTKLGLWRERRGNA